MLKAFITGINGFTGRYLAAELAGAGYEVYGLSHTAIECEIFGVKQVFSCDLNDTQTLEKIISEVRPDVVAHLAAIAFVAYGDVEEIYRTNVVGSRNLLDILARSGISFQSVLVASSANVYGNATAGVLNERAVFAPANDYAVSKVSMEYMAQLYQERLPLIIVRPFNYTGIGQSGNFLLPKIVNHVRSAAPVIELGNLDVSRDFSDVRTVVQYYRLLLENSKAKNQVFNVCSSKAYTLNEVLTMVREISQQQFDVRVNPAFVRANEVKTLIGDNTKLIATVGELKAFSLNETLKSMIEAPL